MILLHTIRRDIKIAFRKPSTILNPLLFFIIAISLFPLAISPEAKVLSQIASGLIWVVVLLAVLLSLNVMFEEDFASGTLEQMTISPHPLALIIFAKSITHFLLTGVPIIVLSPLLGMMLFMPVEQIGLLMITLLLTTPTLSFIGTIGASLVAGVKQSGMLLALIILPLYIPVLIFASGALTNFAKGLEVAGNLYFLATILVAFLMITPFVGSVAVKSSLQ
jgi:heme exporter protein B